MPVQHADDAGRQIRQPWLGAKGARWPMDWTYGEWGLAGASFVIGGTLLVWVIPAGLVAFLLIRSIARFISSRTAPDEPRKTYRLVVACLVILCLLISINPITWIRPIFLPIALAASVAIPFRAVKMFGRYITWNRPITYWLRLPFQVARGPRKAKPVIIDPTPLVPDLDNLGHETDELQPGRIVTVPRIRTKKPPVVRISNARKVPKREQRLVQPGAPPRARRRFVERTPTGIRIGKTEYRLEA